MVLRGKQFHPLIILSEKNLLRVLVPGTVTEGLNGWSEALMAGLAV